MATPAKHGYDVGDCEVLTKSGQKLDTQQLQRYLCVLCKLVLRLPHQLAACGDRICKGCIPTELFKCPSCNENIDPTTPMQFFQDRSCLNDINGFSVRCSCSWSGSLDKWEEHKESCSERDGVAAAQVTPEAFQMTKKQVVELKQLVTRTVQRLENSERETKLLKAKVEELQSSPRLDRQDESSSGLAERLEVVEKAVEKNKKAVEQMTTTLQQVSEAVPKYESILEEMNLKVEILEVKSTTGVYIWKINEISRRQREARTGKTVSLYSPPFYTSLHGYRMCLRAYLNGDGLGKGTHLSIFLVLMRSEYDDLLRWPFSHKVTISLLNQEYPLVPDRAVTHRFAPNPESSSFQKPVDTFNIASGFPQFAELDKLENNQYVRSDTMYIRVRLDAAVDANDTPIVTCPDFLSL